MESEFTSDASCVSAAILSGLVHLGKSKEGDGTVAPPRQHAHFMHMPIASIDVCRNASLLRGRTAERQIGSVQGFNVCMQGPECATCCHCPALH